MNRYLIERYGGSWHLVGPDGEPLLASREKRQLVQAARALVNGRSRGVVIVLNDSAQLEAVYSAIDN